MDRLREEYEVLKRNPPLAYALGLSSLLLIIVGLQLWQGSIKFVGSLHVGHIVAILALFAFLRVLWHNLNRRIDKVENRLDDLCQKIDLCQKHEDFNEH